MPRHGIKSRLKEGLDGLEFAMPSDGLSDPSFEEPVRHVASSCPLHAESMQATGPGL